MTPETLFQAVREAEPAQLPTIAGWLAQAQAELALRLTRAAPAPVPATVADQLLDMEQVATRLGIKQEHAREMGRGGQLPTLKVGRRVRVRESALRKWIDKQERIPS